MHDFPTQTQLCTIKDVAEIFGVCPITASKIMDETGKAIMLHRKKYIRSDELKKYLLEKEGK